MNHIMWTMSDDFQYQYAESWFRKMDKFIHYVNKDGRVNALYSTPFIYATTKFAAGEKWPLKSHDYFPKTRPRITKEILFQIFLCSLFGATLNQVFYFIGLKNSTVTISCALGNILPVPLIFPWCSRFVVNVCWDFEQLLPQAS
ncbi:hypothetical protein Droror1_Dr00025555 [Drosera rotundifolia]